MPFFSLLKPANPADGDYEPERCHINVWSLPGLFWHRPMLFDIGVQFMPAEGLRAIEIAVPVRAAPKIHDLSEAVTNTKIASLIFGKSFTGAHPDKLSLAVKGGGSEDIRVLACDVTGSEVTNVDRELSALRLVLADNPQAGEKSYLRVRLTVDHAGIMWHWQRVLGRRNGALIDFRVPDPREGSESLRRSYERRAKELPSLDAFFMVPERYQLRAANPELKYIRTLEGEAWHPYLGRSIDGHHRFRLNRQRTIVHRWQAGNISQQHLFRGFMQFSREPGFRSPTDLVLNALIIAAVLFALFRPFTARSGVSAGFGVAGDELSALVSLGLAWLVSLGVVAIGFAALTSQRRARRLLIRIKRGWKIFESWWFKIFRD